MEDELRERIWVDPITGEIVDERSEGAVSLGVDEITPHGVLEEGTGPDPEDDHLLEWYSREQVRLDAEEAAAKLKAEDILREIRGRRAAIEYRWEQAVMAIVRQRIAGTKKKSINTSFARLGFRAQQPSVEITMPETLLAWCGEHAPEAIVQPEPYVNKSKIPKALAPSADGLEIAPRPDSFSCRVPKPKKKRTTDE